MLLSGGSGKISESLSDTEIRILIGLATARPLRVVHPLVNLIRRGMYQSGRAFSDPLPANRGWIFGLADRTFVGDPNAEFCAVSGKSMETAVKFFDILLLMENMYQISRQRR